MDPMANVLWFEDLGKADVSAVGGKASSLGELTSRTQVPVPPGFATTSRAYRFFLEQTGLDTVLHDLLQGLDDVENGSNLREVCLSLRNAVLAAPFPATLEQEVRSAYSLLGERAGSDEPFVAVRSSATAEDLPDASFAGQQDSYLNVRGAGEVLERLKQCYASAFTDRAVYYRSKKGFSHLEVSMSAVIQLMVFSEAAGVVFTVDVATGDESQLLIEGALGLGEYVVQGVVTPQSFHVRKSDLFLLKQEIHDQLVRLVRRPDGGCVEEPVPPELRGRSVLTKEQIRQLSVYSLAIEKHYGSAMDIEWGIEERTGQLWILQARPETVWSRKTAKAEPTAQARADTSGRVILVRGLPSSPGRVSARVRVILDPADIDQFQQGEILVTPMTAPDWVVAMKRAAAIVTDTGGMTCHAAIVSRELGIPCIVGTRSRGYLATEVLSTGQEVTVDATNGVVFEGRIDDLVSPLQAPSALSTPVPVESFPVTGTKIYMNLGDPDSAGRYAGLPCDGIGLMREEFIWTNSIHEHPLHLLATGQSEKVVDLLAEGFRKVCQALAPRPVVLRLSDFKSSEYRELLGGDQYEPLEASSLLGWRGASRYYDPKYREAFKLELKAVRRVREELGFKNLHLMIPFCRTVEEASKVTSLMAEEGLTRGPSFKIWLMAEIPSNIILADKFNAFVDGYSIGSNDLTMLVLGCDRDNDTMAYLFDEQNLAIKRAIRHLIEVAHRDGKTVSICGQAPSVYPEFVEFLVRSGIDSLSVNPDAVKSTRRLVAQVEQKLILDQLTGKGVTDVEDYRW